MYCCDQRCWTGVAVRVASVYVTVDCVPACVAVLPVCLQMRTVVHTVKCCWESSTAVTQFLAEVGTVE